MTQTDRSQTEIGAQELSLFIRRRAKELGADLTGFAPADLPDVSEGGPEAYAKWIENGRHGTMSYMERNQGAREAISLWFPPAKSVVVLAFSYADGTNSGASPLGGGRIAQYARSPDYHDALKARLRMLRDEVRERIPNARIKLFVDTSPVLERLYARYAGIGWIGKNTMLISPTIGSFIFLSGFAIDRELIYDEPVPDHCGTCNRCLQACPTSAFPAPHELDASRCIAYLNIELRGSIPPGQREGVGDWLFGCDVCQDVCPWNRFKIQNAAFPAKIPRSVSPDEVVRLTQEQFDRQFGDTPLERAGHLGFVRNALLVMGNSNNAKFRPVIEQFCLHPDPVIQEQAQWSLNRLADS